MSKAVVVDFDLTLVKVNSFELFYKKLFVYGVTNLKVKLIAFLVFQIILRKTKLISHSELKRSVLIFLKNRDYKSFVDNFAIELNTKISDSVLSCITTYKNSGYNIYLCTAAPSLYISPFIRFCKFIFDGVISTPFPQKNGGWVENIRECKRNSILSLLEKKGDMLSIVITDHKDDIPLLQIDKEKNILVNPDKETLLELAAINIPFDIIN